MAEETVRGKGIRSDEVDKMRGRDEEIHEAEETRRR